MTLLLTDAFQPHCPPPSRQESLTYGLSQLAALAGAVLALVLLVQAAAGQPLAPWATGAMGALLLSALASVLSGRSRRGRWRAAAAAWSQANGPVPADRWLRAARSPEETSAVVALAQEALRAVKADWRGDLPLPPPAAALPALPAMSSANPLVVSQMALFIAGVPWWLMMLGLATTLTARVLGLDIPPFDALAALSAHGPLLGGSALAMAIIGALSVSWNRAGRAQDADLLAAAVPNPAELAAWRLHAPTQRSRIEAALAARFPGWSARADVPVWAAELDPR